MVKITLFPPGEGPRKYSVEEWMVKDGMLSFTIAAQSQTTNLTRMRTTLPFLVEFEEQGESTLE
jgi:hypothetical protein